MKTPDVVSQVMGKTETCNPTLYVLRLGEDTWGTTPFDEDIEINVKDNPPKSHTLDEIIGVMAKTDVSLMMDNTGEEVSWMLAGEEAREDLLAMKNYG